MTVGKKTIFALLLLAFMDVASSDESFFNLDVTTHLGDDQVFEEGDQIRLLLNLDRAAYLYIFYRDAAGRLFRIFPNEKDRQRVFPAGSYFALPAKEDNYAFRVSPPFGKEHVHVFASDRRLEPPAGEIVGGGFHLITGSIAKVVNHLNGSARVAGAQMESHSLTIVTHPR